MCGLGIGGIEEAVDGVLEGKITGFNNRKNMKVWVFGVGVHSSIRYHQIFTTSGSTAKKKVQRL